MRKAIRAAAQAAIYAGCACTAFSAVVAFVGTDWDTGAIMVTGFFIYVVGAIVDTANDFI